MPNDSTTSSFPATQRDISNLKQTATDAVSDLSSTAAVHASKAKGQVKELAGHLHEEGGQQLDQVRGQLGDVLASAQAFVAERPLACVGVAFAIGYLFALSRRTVRE
jgi:ElaB/YqjD/DUF883 family membrane-anchored ribosome-binding protein